MLALSQTQAQWRSLRQTPGRLRRDAREHAVAQDTNELVLGRRALILSRPWFNLSAELYRTLFCLDSVSVDKLERNGFSASPAIAKLKGSRPSSPIDGWEGMGDSFGSS